MGSKNNPTNRSKAAEKLFGGEVVKPVKYVAKGSSFMAAQYENNKLVLDQYGNPIAWGDVV